MASSFEGSTQSFDPDREINKLRDLGARHVAAVADVLSNLPDSNPDIADLTLFHGIPDPHSPFMNELRSLSFDQLKQMADTTRVGVATNKETGCIDFGMFPAGAMFLGVRFDKQTEIPPKCPK